ncbi:MAG: homocysteine S-methyltransferase family protein [Acidobacteria bacterium]|nr:homocysteine S-methyltransferase family protein [Acidobacteriota bacterium]
MRLEEWIRNGPVLADGAWGTELQRRGLEPGACPDQWNLIRSEAVAEVARSYVKAGSRVILTNTFRANAIALTGYGLGAEAAAMNRAGAAISREAAAGHVLVAGSIGPTGKMLLLGETTEQEALRAFAQQAQALAEGGVDALLVETMSDLAEAKLALAAARQTGLPVIVSFVFDSGKEKDRTMMGVTPEQAAREIVEAGADAVGANCGLGIAGYVPICRRLRQATPLPVWIKPNAGLPELVGGELVYRTTPAEFAAFVPALVEAGATFIGGCCGTTPDFIRAASQALAAISSKAGA